MRRYIRSSVPGGTYFFTLVTRNRRAVFNNESSVAVLRAAFRQVCSQRPFVMDAIVVLPDHLHCIWRLPVGDADYSTRWRVIKRLVTTGLNAPEGRIWQPRYWEHLIRDEQDWKRHMDYIHYNPVKHGYADCPAEWPWSSFRRCVERGWYEPGWGRGEPAGIEGMDFE